MRRRLHLHVVFEPARLSADYLHHAYAIVVPIVQRTVRMETPVAEHEAKPRGRARVRKEGRGG
jgi:hypothetical protein